MKEVHRRAGHAETAHEQGVAAADLGSSFFSSNLWNAFHDGYIPIPKDESRSLSPHLVGDEG